MSGKSIFESTDVAVSQNAINVNASDTSCLVTNFETIERE